MRPDRVAHSPRPRGGLTAATAAVLWTFALNAGATAQEVGRTLDRPAEVPGVSAVVEFRVRLWAGQGDAIRPIRGGQVWLRPGDGTFRSGDGIRLAETGEDGVYEAVVPAAGVYELHVEAMGFAPVARLVGGRDSRRGLDIHLLPAPVPVEEIVTRIEAERSIERPGHTVHRLESGARPPPSTSLSDWLAGLPGLEVRRRGQGGPQSVTVRGSRPQEVLVLLDGIPINDPLTGIADLSQIPVQSLESATVVLGADSRSGPGATAGLVSLRTRATSEGTAAGLSTGSFGHVAADLATGTSGRLGTLGIGTRVQRSRNDYPFVNRISRDRQTERRRNADRTDAHVTITGHLREVPIRAVGRVDVVERGTPGRMGTRLFDEARWREVSTRLTLGTESEQGSGISIGYARRHQRYTDHRIDRDESLTARQLQLRGRWRPGPSSRWLVTGFAANEDVAGDPLEAPSGRWMAGLTASRAFGSPALDLTPSLTLDVSGRDAVVSPELSVGSRFAERWRVWGRAGQAYRTPTFADLYLASSYQVRANPELSPERVSLDTEIGFEWSPGTLRARGSGFFRHTTDPIVWLPSSTAVWSARNAGTLTALGAEADLQLSPVPGWEMRLVGAWTRSRVRFHVDRAALPYQPAWSGGVVVRRTSGPVRALVQLRYTGGRPTSIAAPHALPGYALVDVAGGRTIRVGSTGVEIELGIRNLLDARYELVELFPEPGRQLMFRVGVRTRPRSGLPSDRQAGNMHGDGPSSGAGAPARDGEIPGSPVDGRPSILPLQ